MTGTRRAVREIPGYKIDASYPPHTIMMQLAAGGATKADGTNAAIQDLLLGALLQRTNAADELATVRLRNFAMTETGIAAAPITDMTVPLTLNANGQLEPGGAGAKVAMPMELASVAGEFIQFRWLPIV